MRATVAAKVTQAFAARSPVVLQNAAVCWQPGGLRQDPRARACAQKLQLRTVGNETEAAWGADFTVVASIADIGRPGCLAKWQS